MSLSDVTKKISIYNTLYKYLVKCINENEPDLNKTGKIEEIRDVSDIKMFKNSRTIRLLLSFNIKFSHNNTQHKIEKEKKKKKY